MVVGDFRFLSLSDIYRNGFFHRNVVGIRNPADICSVGFVGVCELGRAPALNWFPHELTRANDDCENDEEEDGISMIKAVDPVIVVVSPEFGDRRDGS